MAKAGTLPQVCYVWSPAGFDEHPPATNNPGYVTAGHDLVWQRVQAVIDGGGWQDTTFILTWDDWGGYTDSIPTPAIETAVDALHPGGFAVIGGSRIPLLMFGGKVSQGIDNRWHSHASIPKTIIDLLALPALGVPRVDTAPSLADRVDPTLTRPQPPAYGTVITQPTPPTPTPAPVTPDPWPGPLAQPMPDLVTLDGSVLPAPADAVVHATPPKPPKPPTPTPPPAAPPHRHRHHHRGHPARHRRRLPHHRRSPGPAANLDALVDKAYAGKTRRRTGGRAAGRAERPQPDQSHRTRPSPRRHHHRRTGRQQTHPGRGHHRRRRRRLTPRLGGPSPPAETVSAYASLPRKSPAGRCRRGHPGDRRSAEEVS